MVFQRVVFLGIVSVLANATLAQTHEVSGSLKNGIDTTYVANYKGMLMARTFLGGKLSRFELTFENGDPGLFYTPNSPLTLGLGFTVKALSVNVGYGFKFLNPEGGMGKSKFKDFMTSIYSPRFAIDLYASFITGNYLENTMELNPNYGEPYYLRPDLYQQTLGFSGHYVFNHERYSYRAAMIQSEQQLKSAGSLLVGFEGYYGMMVGDSAMAPHFLDTTGYANPRYLQANRYSYVKAGPSVGYSYTFVARQKFYVMASLTLNLAFGNNVVEWEGLVEKSEINLAPGALIRLGIGYNTRNWALGLTTIINSTSTSYENEAVTTNYSSGMIRLNFERRFFPGKKTKRLLDKLPG